MKAIWRRQQSGERAAAGGTKGRGVAIYAEGRGRPLATTYPLRYIFPWYFALPLIPRSPTTSTVAFIVPSVMFFPNAALISRFECIVPIEAGA